ncbi:MAG: FtsL-like putative cell division protein [Porphyromonas sp.]|uniref:FtsL-like putative cell division protein n=1 Tax=Porphyromonas sp. TaxID=1924944 RepID=UPI002A75742C|nr:FtsL-like putative cell division protein [Porphyromonas sp.]MDD6928393.1 FtsL-like putative cell division protein [Bacteroidales bacterium]MDY3112465.1 FtsL-like putative cell division protein [Porphyromonas sp.]
MVKIDETYFEDDLEEELQERTPIPTDESAVVPQPKPLLADLLEEEIEAELSEQDETKAPSDDIPSAIDLSDYEVTSAPATPVATCLDESNDLGKEEDKEEEGLSEESDQSTRKRSSRGLWYWLGGDMLEQPAFRKYIPAFIAILLMGLIHVTSNYQIIAKRRQIDKLETRVKDLTYKHMESVSELTRRSIGGNFEQQLQAMGSDLEAPSQQSIILYRDDKK